MIENKKYFSETGNPKKNLVLDAIYLLSMIYLFGFTVDYKNISIPYFILLIFIALFGLLTFFVQYQTKKGKLYLTYEGNTLIKTGIFNSSSKIDMTNGYKIKETKRGIHYITIKNEKGVDSMLIGTPYKKHFDKLIELLESKQK